jgi:hypothetical protein
VYVDASGIDSALNRQRVRSERGMKVNDTVNGRKFAYANVVAALSGNLTIAPYW